MSRYATGEDVSRIAEILVFGKRVAYRTIFNNDVDSFKNLQVLDVIEEYQNNCVKKIPVYYIDGESFYKVNVFIKSFQ